MVLRKDGDGDCRSPYASSARRFTPYPVPRGARLRLAREGSGKKKKTRRQRGGRELAPPESRGTPSFFLVSGPGQVAPAPAFFRNDPPGYYTGTLPIREGGPPI